MHNLLKVPCSAKHRVVCVQMNYLTSKGKACRIHTADEGYKYDKTKNQKIISNFRTFLSRYSSGRFFGDFFGGFFRDFFGELFEGLSLPGVFLKMMKCFAVRYFRVRCFEIKVFWGMGISK